MAPSGNVGHEHVEAPGPVRVTVNDIGGISEQEVAIRPGVTVLSGRNATNRTSLLTALVGALGGEMATLKSDADSGSVELELDGRTYERAYTRDGDGVSTSGSALTDDGDIVDLFVGLLEGNAARRAVERGDDLREIIMQPVDTAEIRRRIREAERERERIDAELDEIERKRSNLPALEERRTELRSELEDVTAELDAVRERAETRDVSQSGAEQAESILADLEERRAERDRLDADIETQQSSLDALRDEREDVDAALDDLTVDEARLDDLDRRIDRLRSRKRELDDLISDLSAIVDVNERLVDSEVDGLPSLDTGDEDPTDALDPSSMEFECWTCGSRVPKRSIDDRIDELRAVIDDQRDKRRDVVNELDEVDEKRAAIRSTADERDDLETRRREIERKIDRREERLDSLRDERQTVQAKIERLETRLEEAEAFEDDELAATYQRLSDLEYERGQLDQQLTELDAEIEEVEELADERSRLDAQRDELQAEIASLRSRIEDLERSAVEQFNDRMAELLDLLEYENLERVWIERRAEREETTRFALHVVRESETGSVYEDSVDTLSESEREIIGLVVALAGYLVHDVHDEVPFLLLDSLESIDADRITDLLDYFSDYAPYLVVALLPEDADVVDIDHERIPAETFGT